MNGALRVVKLGGSLLDWPDLADRLPAWLAREPAAATVFVVGGGALVDKLRELDRAQAFTPQSAHWLAVQAMSLTARVTARMMQDWRLIESLDQVERNGAPPQVLDVEGFLRQLEHSGDPLPASWEVTSDSIAARVAATLGLKELVLLKSTLPAAAGREAWAAGGYVDAYFPRASQGLKVRAVDLRSPDFSQTVDL